MRSISWLETGTAEFLGEGTHRTEVYGTKRERHTNLKSYDGRRGNASKAGGIEEAKQIIRAEVVLGIARPRPYQQVANASIWNSLATNDMQNHD
jgi:hypothetical protein